MKGLIHAALLGPALMLAAPALAQGGQHSDLPPAELVGQALDSHPAVKAAEARVAAARAQAGMLVAGPHEIMVQGSYLRRSVNNEGGFNEFDTTVSRPFRLPGKASLDRKAGDFGVEAAQNRMEDVRHQTALVLAGLWYDWMTASAVARNDADMVSNLDRALAAVRRRAALRDAADLDIDQAAAALALAQGQLAQSQATAAEARVKLVAQFPDLPLPAEAPDMANPHDLPQNFEELRGFVITRSHEIGAAQAEAQKQAVTAQRAKAERIADPSLGFRLFSERGGAEKGVGVVASLPIGGRYRSRAADEAAAMASSARLEQGVVERDVQMMADADLSNARTRLIVWEQVREARIRAESMSERTSKGYALGAIDLTDLLYAERQANDARRAEIGARADAGRAIIKLEIDSHTIWAPVED
jgi:outer membrane protein TolC